MGDSGILDILAFEDRKAGKRAVTCNLGVVRAGGGKDMVDFGESSFKRLISRSEASGIERSVSGIYLNS